MPPEAPGSTGSGPVRPTAARRVLTAIAALAVAGAVAAIVVAGVMGFRLSDSDEATLRGFQIRVLSISQAAAENRMDGALAALQALEKDLDAAARDGRISAPRLLGIETALAAVRTEIAGQLAAPAPASGTAGLVGPSAAAPANPTVPQTQPVQPVPGEQAVAPQPVPVPAGQEAALPEAAKDAKGKGKGQGKP
ncbi:hypothetical protein [Arthrobacter sp. Cr_A7]|uniref:hypothetical protein n=1 Tax=Arthrobacter sp. Cr_A7 TaxID=3031017 RepID=UPI0023DC6908|nr:hypothetical protein [Arthrobacter sp. Cr_A7]MDF2052306.1 hypothetical protein [Arthrobacter sp. Cr_A7]